MLVFLVLIILIFNIVTVKSDQININDHIDTPKSILMPKLLPYHEASKFDDKMHIMPSRIMKLCDNEVVRSITRGVNGSVDAIMKSIQDYKTFMIENPSNLIKPFENKWKFEFNRVSGPQVPICASFKIFGKKYDEMKYFCVVNGKRQESGEKEDSSSCSAYSVGSFELYDFELEFLRNTNCTVDTFDCTVAGGKVPEEIKNSNRFKFHQVCLSRNNARDHQVLTAEEAAIGVPIKAPPGYNRGPYNFSNIRGLNAHAKRTRGPDYFKMDIEGFEWGVLKNMVRWATIANTSVNTLDVTNVSNVSNGGEGGTFSRNHNKKLMKGRDAQLPLQLFIELHLDRDSTPDNKYHSRLTGSRAMVSGRLRHFLDEMFIRGGYMVMFSRKTIQTRNTDVLLTKILCAK